MQSAPSIPDVQRQSVSPGPVPRGRLDATLARLNELGEAIVVGRTDVPIAQVLSELRVDLELHFAKEESNAHFGAFLRERQSLSQRINQLEKEHRELLAELDRLRALAADPARIAELVTPAAHLVGQFREHEQRELDLVEEFVLRDDGIGAD
jgi:chromosome segregation ATPase